MGTRRVLSRIRLDKIAAVTQPCQEPALAVICKRAPEGAPPAIVKKTFEEALSAQLVSEKVSDTFWRAFENQWAIKDAFRTALTDELAEGGDGRTATNGFVRAMENLATAAAAAARDAASTADTDLEAAVEDAVSKFMLQHQEQPMKISNKAQLQKAVADFNPETSPAAHVGIIQKAAADLGAEDELPAEGVLAKAEPAVDPAEFAKVKRDLAISKLSDDARAHFDTLDAGGQDAFLAKSADEQAAAIAEINKADPIIYTAKDGTQIRKSDGALMAKMAKRQDELESENADLRKGQSEDRIEKRARTEFPNVALTVATDMLKSADQVGADSESGKSIMKSLVAMNAAGKGSMQKLGTTEGGDAPTDIAKARTDFDTEVAKVAREEKISKTEAMSKVRSDQPELFAKAYPQLAEEDEA